MSFTLILAEVLDFFQPLKYSINNNVFKIKVKRSFLILSKKRALLFFFAIARSGKSPALEGEGKVDHCETVSQVN